MKKIIAFTFLIALLLSLCSCSSGGADVRIGGMDIYFIPEEEVGKWEENIASLLANTRIAVTSDDVYGEILGYDAPDPTRPSVELGYDYGLLDIDLDGVPELLVNLGGGSAGNAFYEVYDIMTGENKGTLDGGYDGDICVYVDAKNGGFALVGEYVWRMGWDTRMHFTNIIATRGDIQNAVSLYAGYTLTIDEEIVGSHFTVDGAEVGFERYKNARAHFEKSNIRISETALVLIPREDEWSEESAAAIAHALVTSAQRFVDWEQ